MHTAPSPIDLRPLERLQLVRETFTGMEEYDHGKKTIQAGTDHPYAARGGDQARRRQDDGRGLPGAGDLRADLLSLAQGIRWHAGIPGEVAQ